MTDLSLHAPEMTPEPQTEAPARGFFDGGSPRMIFVFGLMAGIAVTSLGYDIFRLNPDDTNAAGTGVAVPNDTENAPAAAKKLAEVTNADHVRGDLKKAKVVLVEYSDYECPFCSRHHPTMQALVEKYGDDIAWVYRHFPLSFHPEAKPAALAAECANEQGKFWEYTDALFENQDSLGGVLYADLAAELGLDVPQFTDCVASEKYAGVLTKDMTSGRDAGVSGTPATFVNGTMVSGAVDIATFASMIDAVLKK